jgi:NAD(P)-dependent dehydrogenase (short-subunit alcohol dehydrogenase family)
MAAPVFLVTGGSRGIGESVAIAAARTGRFVLLTYVESEAAALAVVERIRAQGGQALAMKADTGVEADVLKVFEEVDRQGRLETLVYNSAITGAASRLADADTSNFARVVEVNLTGAMVCAREAVRRMSTARGGEGGSIVFVSSRAALYGSPGEFVWYAASKGGIDSLTIGLSREVGAEGIRVNAVSPGPIATAMLSREKLEAVGTVSPMKRAGAPEEVAAAILFLASDAASYITGANLAVSGGR